MQKSQVSGLFETGKFLEAYFLYFTPKLDQLNILRSFQNFTFFCSSQCWQSVFFASPGGPNDRMKVSCSCCVGLLWKKADAPSIFTYNPCINPQLAAVVVLYLKCATELNVCLRRWEMGSVLLFVLHVFSHFNTDPPATKWQITSILECPFGIWHHCGVELQVWDSSGPKCSLGGSPWWPLPCLQRKDVL